MEKTKINILSKFFSKSTFYHCYENGYDKVYSRVIDRYINQGAGKTNVELVGEIYNIVQKEYRNEYFYKNTLLNKLLLGVHSINTTTALTEVPIAKSKADFVLINGKAVVYEIKTELDNLDRLENQINDYYKAFDHVSVVTYNKNIEALQKKIDSIQKPVGIYTLQKSGSIKTIRKPEEYKASLEPQILYKILRKSEYEDIILKRYGTLPRVSDFSYYTECKKLFMQIPIEESYVEVLKLLKKRNKIIKEHYEKIPYELKFLAYFMELKEEDYRKINLFLNQTYGGL